MNRYLLALGMLLPLAAVGAPSLDPEAGSMRCGRSLVEVGDEAFVLLDKCGDPDFRQVVAIGTYSDATRTRAGKRQFRAEDRATLVTEEWVYRQGRGRLAKILTVTGGVLTSIRVSDRQ
ncbi:MAG: DUF2845 domain-containing protein [Xanthomonadales bacterium]|nr:DUF2845 domain-containing protein [Xanthomonadales bacterium]